jgi:hypothetical protein
VFSWWGNKYGGGGDWYGENELFGAFNEYKQSGSLDFTFDGITSSGHTIFVTTHLPLYF